MNKLIVCKFFYYSLAVFSLAGCGGGGGSGGGSAVQQPTTAVLRLSTQGTLSSNTSIAGIGITVNLPQGVTVETDAGGVVSNTVAIPSGVAAQSIITPPIYTPATSEAPGKLNFVLASKLSSGFGTGEFITVNCDISTGAIPKAADFGLTYFKPVDLYGAAISGVSVTFVADIK
ncbi:hypothetical protein [Geobacter sp. AOG2]|uniref:hypothetical protein n=1 Tax=Geobacter sp. AOG2 TaxID=1566347 RepID=UPI001CC6869C|nr:hypothetical protein [Geobacter sp. AOG2]GFE60789.1 hypothetical protein AOG2_13770 [Geobacter sp. AOG2]